MARLLGAAALALTLALIGPAAAGPPPTERAAPEAQPPAESAQPGLAEPPAPAELAARTDGDPDAEAAGTERADPGPPINDGETDSRQGGDERGFVFSAFVWPALAVVAVILFLLLAAAVWLQGRTMAVFGTRRDFQRMPPLDGERHPDSLIAVVEHLVRLHAELRAEVRELRRQVEGRVSMSAPQSASLAEPPPEARRQPPPAPLPPPPPPGFQALLRRIESAYAETRGAPRQLRQFREEHRPLSVSAGRLSDGAAALVWAVPVDGDRFALVPGNDLVTGFAVNFLSERSMPEDVRNAFQFEIDQTRELRLIRAGVARVAPDGSLEVLERGLIGGLTD